MPNFHPEPDPRIQGMMRECMHDAGETGNLPAMIRMCIILALLGVKIFESQLQKNRLRHFSLHTEFSNKIPRQKYVVPVFLSSVKIGSRGPGRKAKNMMAFWSSKPWLLLLPPLDSDLVLSSR